MSQQEHPPNLQSDSGQRIKTPQTIFDFIFAFPPNRDTLGGSAYLIVENNANILVDCPARNQTNCNFLQQHGGFNGWYSLIPVANLTGRKSSF